jgi:hypothetical protein
MPGIDEALDKALDAEEVNEDENNPTASTTKETAEEEVPTGAGEEEAAGEASTEDGNSDGGNDDSADSDEQREIAAGLELIKALKDPVERRKMIQYLATESGFNISEATPQEKKLFEKSVNDVLKEKLADEYSLLPSGLGDTLEEIINARVDARVKPIETELLNAREAAHKNSLQSELDWAYTNLNGFKKHENAILAKMQKLYKSPDASVRDYLTDLYNVVVPAEEKTSSIAPVKSPPSAKNDRLKLSPTGGSGGKAPKAPSKTPAPANKSLDEALDLALDAAGV